MGRLRNFIALLAFLPLVSTLTACDLRGFSIMIPDFDVSEVQGVRVWEEDPVTGDLVETVAITFEDSFVDATAGEVLIYGFSIDGQPLQVTVPTLLTRNPENPDLVSLDLRVMPIEGGGIYRVSTFNEFGDSPLAEGAFTL